MSLKVVLFVSFLCTANRSQAAADNGKVLGRIYGTAAVFGIDYGWMASVHSKEFKCGGTIINPRTILTTAQCAFFADLLTMEVRVGSKYKSSGGQLIPVEMTIYHIGYDKTTTENNIALIRLSHHIDITDDAHRIRVAPSTEHPEEGTLGFVCGWGETSHGIPEFLHCADVIISNQTDCKTRYQDTFPSGQIICANFVGDDNKQCYMDMGGPLVVNGTVVGLVTWPFNDSCTKPDEPIAFTDVASHYDWITSSLTALDEDWGE